MTLLRPSRLVYLVHVAPVVDPDQALQQRIGHPIVEIVEQVQEGDLALALDQQIDFGAPDGLRRIQVHVRAA
ncbi:MAG: hypothetical protein ACYSUI_11030 [Planctomycetota bacterium]